MFFSATSISMGEGADNRLIWRIFCKFVYQEVVVVSKDIIHPELLCSIVRYYTLLTAVDSHTYTHTSQLKT